MDKATNNSQCDQLFAEEKTVAYFESLAAYLNSGELALLEDVFPSASNLKMAAVYRNGFIKNCCDALQANFPTVENLVGESYFKQLAQHYVQSNPPEHSNLNTFGVDFPKFVSTLLPQHGLAYLTSFAQLDAAWTTAYFAADTTELTADDVQAWIAMDHDIPALPATLVASANICALDNKVTDVWSTLKVNGSVDDKVTILPESEFSLIWRNAQQHVLAQPLAPAELAFLQVLSNQATIGEAAQAAFEADVSFDVSSYFSNLLAHQVLAPISNSEIN